MHFNSVSIFMIYIFLSILLKSTFGLPIEEEEKIVESDPSSYNTWTLVIFLSVGFALTLVAVFQCALGGCCKSLPRIYWFGRSAQSRDAPTSFENPVAVGNFENAMPLAQIDVRALELDPVVIEPLPTIHDLSPQTLSATNKVVDDKSYATPYHRSASTSAVIPFAAEDCEIYANDWFDEPFGNFPRSNLEYVSIVGRGWFGQVLEAEARDIVPYASKIRVYVKSLREDASQIDQMRFLDEARVYRDARQGNILKLLGHSIEKLPFLLIMEMCSQGDLKSYLISNVTRAEILSSSGTLLKMALDIAKGLEWMQKEGFLHHDLAARNCQVAGEDRIVIGDYGLATSLFKDDYYWNSDVPIPIRWASPEILHCTPNTIQTLKVTKTSNIWSFGIVLWEITEFAKLPYFELSDEEVITRVMCQKKYFLGAPTLPYIRRKDELYSIMRCCWDIDASSRPKISSIVNSLGQILRESPASACPKDDFESRWEQYGSPRLSSSGTGSLIDDDRPRVKKSVSFVGFSPGEDEQDSLLQEKSNDASDIHLEDAQKKLAQETYLKTASDDDAEAETEEFHDAWLEEAESGEVSKKVLEKSQSVQDLMVLTHVESADMTSLTFNPQTGQDNNNDTKDEEEETKSVVSNSGSTSSQSSIVHSDANHSNVNKIGFTKDNFHKPTPAMTNSKLNMGFDAIFNYKSPTVALPSSKNITITVENQHSGTSSSPTVTKKISTPLQPPVDINIIKPTPGTTPNLTNVDIKVTEPTPSPAPTTSKEKPKIESLKNRHLDEFRSARLTSTPKRSSDRSPVDCEFNAKNENGTPNDDDSDVFEEPSFNYSLNLSPISNKASETLATSSALMGPSDDFSFQAFQGVTSQGEVPTSRAFVNGRIVEPHELFIRSNDSQILVHDSSDRGEDSSSWNVISANATALKMDTNSDEIPNDSSWENITQSASASINIPNERHSDEKSVEKEDRQKSPEMFASHFVAEQLQSVTAAAMQTKSLFDLARDDNDELRPGDDFAEDVSAADEESNSLLYEDLETNGQVVVPKTSHTVDSPERKVKLAFVSPDQDSDKSSHGGSRSDETTSVVSWDLESRDTGDDGEKAGGSLCNFVPSSWNQSLLPARPAIKSPSTDFNLSSSSTSTSFMKKSVSFDCSTNQVVYEYPPPPPASDSEEEVTVVHKVAAAATTTQSATNGTNNSAKNHKPIFGTYSTLDWDLSQEDLEVAPVVEDSEDEVNVSSTPMDVYNISGFDENSFKVRPSSEPFGFAGTKLGELRHTRDKLKLDLCKGEASILDDDEGKLSSKPNNLDSGVGSTAPSPFMTSQCDSANEDTLN